MFIEQIIEFELRGPRPPSSTRIPTLLKFLGPADPKNPGQRPLTQNFWVKIFGSL